MKAIKSTFVMKVKQGLEGRSHISKTSVGFLLRGIGLMSENTVQTQTELLIQFSGNESLKIERETRETERNTRICAGIISCVSFRFACFAFYLCFVSGHSLYAQTLPDLPAVVSEDFGPEIREQVRKAYADARANPRDAEANGRLGMTLHTYEQHELAAVCYERARHLAPDEFRWVYYFGVVQAALGNHRLAVAAFKDALRRKPDHLPSQRRLADSLFATGQLNESQAFYEAVIKKNPGSAQTYYGLGRIKAATKDVTTAAEHFRKALDLFPDYGAAHYALGLVLRDLGQIAKAQEHLALSQKHKFSRPPLEDELLNAITELNVAATKHLQRGVTLESEGEIEQSIAEHERALEINPNLTQAHINLISLYGRAGKIEMAEKHYRAVLEINPNLADSHYNFGVLMAGQERYREAAQAFQRSLQINQFNADAHHNYAAMIERDGRLEEAAEHYRKAIENKPGFRLAHFHLGRILVNQSKLAEAIEHFLQTLSPEDENTPRFMYALGATYARAGERRKGIYYLQEALKRAAVAGQSQLVSSIERDLRILERSVDKPAEKTGKAP
jgi:tetratricopeptide (TPR) repeat protein